MSPIPGGDAAATGPIRHRPRAGRAGRVDGRPVPRVPRGPRLRDRIAFRIFAFNALLAFLPAAAFSLLDTYERGLVASLEHALAQQARVTAAWLGQTAVLDPPSPRDIETAPILDPAASRRVLAAIGDRRTARFRIVDTRGRLLADSSDREAAQASFAAEGDDGSTSRSASVGAVEDGGEPFLYRLFSTPARVWRRFLAPPSPPLPSADYYASSGPTLLGSEVRDALDGRYGAATRVSSGGQVSVTLYSAVPVYSAGGSVAGAVLVSQSTYRILRDLYAIRLDIAWIFVGSLALALALSVILAFTIVSPLRKLGAAAAAVLAPLGSAGRPGGGPGAGRDAATAFPESRRGDEIGDLQRSIRGLVLRLEGRMRQIERFAADAAHEFRNPIAAIRSAAELAEGASDAADRSRFHRAIIDDAERLRATIDGLRRLSLAEAGAQTGALEDIDAATAAAAACESIRLRGVLGAATEGQRRVQFSVSGGEGLCVRADPAALDVMLGNLLDNAASFARGLVSVSLRSERGLAVIEVEDDGPGIPPEHLGRVFDRFFTWRPGERRGTHTGLGLSLARALAEAGGGSLEASRAPGGGALFRLSLPSAG